MAGFRERLGGAETLVYLLTCWAGDADYGYGCPSGCGRQGIDSCIFLMKDTGTGMKLLSIDIPIPQGS